MRALRPAPRAGGQPVASSGVPLHESRCVVVMIHGRGRDTADILALAERIDLPEVAYIAPAAQNSTWYPASFLEPIGRMRESAEIFGAMGAQVVQGFYDGSDHLVSDQEIAAARTIIS